MSTFCTGKALNEAIYRIIWDAKERLLLVSPYIRLDDYFKSLLEKHSNSHKLEITLVFGKNEDNVSKSLNKSDFAFLAKFPNISVIYVHNLHGKYYGNEQTGIITSVNLHDYSFDHNIEFGVLTETPPFKLAKSIDDDAWNTGLKLANEGIPVLINRPMYEKKLFGKNFIKSVNLLDQSEHFYRNLISNADTSKKLQHFETELFSNPKKGPMPQKEIHTLPENGFGTKRAKNTSMGFCIRTGVSIPRNPEKPLCYDSWQEWVGYENYEYPEKYCHFSGEKSHGRTSFKRPILNDTYRNKPEHSKTKVLR